ncbi:hypothetical protein DERP_001988, partial [Dermatophagoides pteronyssinus]
MSSNGFWLLITLFLSILSHQLTIADEKKEPIVHHESSSILIHFTLDHFRGPLWKMSNLVYLSNDNNSNYQRHFRHWPIRNRIGWKRLWNLDRSSNGLVRLDNNDATMIIRRHYYNKNNFDKNRLHFVISCDINSDQTNRFYSFIQNCSLHQIDTIVIRKLIRPKFNLLLNIFHNTTYRWERTIDYHNYPIMPTKLDDRTSLRLVSVLEENKRMILKCMFKKRCIIKHENQSTYYDFDVVHHNVDDNTDELNSRFQRQLIHDDYDYYEYDD